MQIYENKEKRQKENGFCPAFWLATSPTGK